MPVLINNEALVPFLSKPMHFIKGLDPLGLQNTSEATFALLLPGLNNVTGRVRFYSFYCWLLQEYAKRSGSTNPADQRKFIRRAELIIALVNRSTEDEVAAIPGSNYANRQLKEGYKVHDLERGTYNEDGTTEETYWKNPGGAFGQYYLGSLMDIGLVVERENHSTIYVRTPHTDGIAVSGEDLALAFDENISPKNKNLFFDCIKSGKIKSTDFDILFSEFNLSNFPSKGQERPLLLKLLIEKDYPQLLEEEPLIFRKQTIKHILHYAEEGNELTDRNFTVFAYFQKGLKAGVIDDCLTGWYYYQLNEYWQYACLGVFNGSMDYLETAAGSSWKNLYQLVEEVTERTLKHLLRDEVISSKTQSMKELVSEIDGWVDETELFQYIKDKTGTERVANSFMLLLSLYRNNIDYFDRLKSFGVNNEIEKDGDGVTYYLKFEKHSSIGVNEFIRDFLLKNIIYRHQFVAFRKMGGGTQSTQLFIIEDGLIRRLKNNFDPALTGPRIARLIRFLSDLHILKNAELTKEGDNFLTKLSDEAA